MSFGEWLTKTYVDWRGDAIGNERSIVEFSRWLGIDKASISLWMKGTRQPGKLSITRIAKKFPEVYGVLGMPAPGPDQLEVLPDELRDRFKKLFREVAGEYLARNKTRDDPDAERIVIEIMERNGINLTSTSSDDTESTK